MRATADVTISCTLDDQFRLIELAREEVQALKPRDDWELFYPQSPSEALQLLIRSAIASKLQSTQAVTLHEIGQLLRHLDLPL